MITDGTLFVVPHNTDRCGLFIDVDDEGCVVGIEVVFGEKIKVKS